MVTYIFYSENVFLDCIPHTSMLKYHNEFINTNKKYIRIQCRFAYVKKNLKFIETIITACSTLGVCVYML